jgi:transposase
MEETSQYIGIDVSKATLDVYIRPLGLALKVSNTEAEIALLVEFCQSHNPKLIVLEATGGLEAEAIIQLQAAELPVALINPRQGRDFAKALGYLAKTDAIDAKVLAHFGEAVKPKMIWGGRAHIRASLYMGALVATRFNPVIKEFYDRLVERGKSKKVAITACVRKMLVILNAMVRDNKPWSTT